MIVLFHYYLFLFQSHSTLSIHNNQINIYTHKFKFTFYRQIFTRTATAANKLDTPSPTAHKLLGVAISKPIPKYKMEFKVS